MPLSDEVANTNVTTDQLICNNFEAKNHKIDRTNPKRIRMTTENDCKFWAEILTLLDFIDLLPVFSTICGIELSLNSTLDNNSVARYSRFYYFFVCDN